MNENIIVKGAREHNLKNIDVTFPRNKFVVITGLSGSGKSTLAFDTIYSEGNRRYVESLSAYARQFLGNMRKPDVDSIEGLSPAISIEQKTTSKNPRSTVGTITEIYDYLRLLYAKIGVSHCPKCNEKVKAQSCENITNLILTQKNKKILILSPIIRGLKGTYEKVFDNLLKEGFRRVRVDGQIYKLENVKDEVKLKRYEKHWIEAVVDRVIVKKNERQRIYSSCEQALHCGEGTLIVLDIEKEEELKKNFTKLGEKELKEIQRECESVFSNFGACPNHPQIVFEEPEARQFSFNSPFGACPKCLGIGKIIDFDEKLIVPDKTKSVASGAVLLWSSKIELRWQIRGLKSLCSKYRFDIFTPLSKLNQKEYEALLYGDSEFISKENFAGRSVVDCVYEGVIPMAQRLYRQTQSNSRKVHFERFMSSHNCHKCLGKRLKENMLSVKIQELSIIDVTELTIEKALEFFKMLREKLTDKEKIIAKQILKEVVERLTFLNNVGLGYLTLDRSSATLSGGEAQRIRLATQIGANLMGVLYVLDEPSIGLHQRDNSKLIKTLKNLRDLGNTLIVVEHDEETMKESDFIIDMGVGAGIHGGEIVACGDFKEIMGAKKSLTGQYLSGEKKIEVPKKRREITFN